MNIVKGRIGISGEIEVKLYPSELALRRMKISSIRFRKLVENRAEMTAEEAAIFMELLQVDFNELVTLQAENQ
jgi:plasmid maintenance system antidote protein VapI